MEYQLNHSTDIDYSEKKNKAATLCDMVGMSEASKRFVLENDEIIDDIIKNPETYSENVIKTTMAMLKTS